jgi:hypothetical protein
MLARRSERGVCGTGGAKNGNNELAVGKTRSWPRRDWRFVMLWTILVILLVLWLLGVVTSTTMGGLVHILLVVAVILLVVQLVSGRRVV